MSGLDSTGFSVKLLTEILADIQTSERNTIDAGLDLSSEKALGQLNGVFSEREALLWELIQTAMSAFDPDQAEGYLLEALSALTGTTRRAASRSLVDVTVNLDATVTLPTGSVANVSGQPTKTFRTTADITSTTAGNYPGVMESVAFGPIAAPSGTLTTITGPVTGWNSVTNAEDAALGRLEDTDSILRARRKEGLFRAGSSTPDAIRGDLLAIEGVEKVTVFENLTDFVTDDDIPAHSIEVLVYDGIVPAVSNSVIAQAIWNAKSPVRTFGNTSGIAVDSEGVTRSVKFSRPVEIDVWVTATVTSTGVVPSTAATLLRDQLVSAANADLQPGFDVIALSLKCLLLDTKKELGYSWVTDVPTLLLGFSSPPTLGVNLTITPREIARLDTSRTTITII